MRFRKTFHFSIIITVLLTLSACISFKPDVAPLNVETVPEAVEFGAVNANSADNSPNQLPDTVYPSAPPEITDPGMNSPWKQIDAPYKNSPDQRSLDAYIALIEQFDVANSYPERYQIGGAGLQDTRCNIFAGDVMRAMGAPLPTKGELGKGSGNSKNTDPMTANAKDLNNWLNQEQQGWKKIDPNNPADLQLMREYLQVGKPVLASDPGHIAVVRPDNLPAQLNANNLGDLHIAQAGAYNTNDIALTQAGYNTRFIPTFFIHN